MACVEGILHLASDLRLTLCLGQAVTRATASERYASQSVLAEGRWAKISIKEDGPADLILFDPELSWCYLAPQSKSSNSPWLGKTLKGKVLLTMCEGAVVYEDERNFGDRRLPVGKKMTSIP